MNPLSYPKEQTTQFTGLAFNKTVLLRSSTLILKVSDIVEVMTSVLDNEEDEDGHLSCLLITQDLLCKDSEGLFLEQFAKLGLFSKVRKKKYTLTI